MTSPEEPPVSPNRRVRLRNNTCPYCRTRLAAGAREIEHVIGRRFVPRGTLQAAWNLHVWSCRPCNFEKSQLEDDISAITLLGRVSAAGEVSDAGLLKEASRKAMGSISRKTGRSVANSDEAITIRGKLGPAQASITMRAPAQLDRDRAHRLALFQLKALFYWLTYNRETEQGGFWPGALFPVDGTNKSDFGNVVQRAFADRVIGWDYRLVVTTAATNIQAAIRKHPTAAAWSFALEWNGNFRLIGFFGDEATCEAEREALPKLEPDFLHEDGPHVYAIRANKVLAEEEDLLFIVPDEAAPDGNGTPQADSQAASVL